MTKKAPQPTQEMFSASPDPAAFIAAVSDDGEVAPPESQPDTTPVPTKDITPEPAAIPAAPQHAGAGVIQQHGGGWLDPATYAHLGRIAMVFAKSSMVPKEYQGKSENCFIAVQMAHRFGVDPLMMIQNLSVINNRPVLSSSMLLALAAQSKVFSGPILHKVKKEGGNIEVTAYAKLAHGVEVSVSVDLNLAKADGWTRNPKYQSMPEHMLTYRASTWLIRRYAPQVLLGLHTREEIEDVQFSNNGKSGKK